MYNSKKFNNIAKSANEMLYELSRQITDQKKEFKQDSFHLNFSKSSAAKLHGLTKSIVDKSINEMEAKGYKFKKKKSGATEKYALTIENVVDIYKHRGYKSYKDKYKKAFTICITNLKGGVSKTVSTVSLAHALRVHPHLIKEDLKILVIDLDPQSSATMFLNHEYSIGSIENTSAQALLHNISAKELKEEFIIPSVINNVDVIPASIEDAFIASEWNSLCKKHIPNINEFEVLYKNIITKLEDHYDFIFIDNGPHLDAFLMNSLACADLLITPIPPSQVDFHSTLKYLTRLPELIKLLENNKTNIRLKANIGFMSKMANKADHKMCLSLAKEVFGYNMLDSSLPKLDAFERCGESFDTIFSVNPSTYVGSLESLKKTKIATEDFTKSVFDKIELIRNEDV